MVGRSNAAQPDPWLLWPADSDFHPDGLCISLRELQDRNISGHFDAWPQAPKEPGAGPASGAIHYRESGARGPQSTPAPGMIERRNGG